MSSNLAAKSYFHIISMPVNPNFSVEQLYVQHKQARARYSFDAICYEHSLLIYFTAPWLSGEGFDDFVCDKNESGKWFEDVFSFNFERRIDFLTLKVPCVMPNGRNLTISCPKIITWNSSSLRGLQIQVEVPQKILRIHCCVYFFP